MQFILLKQLFMLLKVPFDMLQQLLILLKVSFTMLIKDLGSKSLTMGGKSRCCGHLGGKSPFLGSKSPLKVSSNKLIQDLGSKSLYMGGKSLLKVSFDLLLKHLWKKMGHKSRNLGGKSLCHHRARLKFFAAAFGLDLEIKVEGKKKVGGQFAPLPPLPPHLLHAGQKPPDAKESPSRRRKRNFSINDESQPTPSPSKPLRPVGQSADTLCVLYTGHQVILPPPGK